MLRQVFSSRVTLLLLGVSIAEVPAGAHRDLQAGSVRVVVEAKLQFSHHTEVVKDTKVCADAAVAGLKGSNTEEADDARDWRVRRRSPVS